MNPENLRYRNDKNSFDALLKERDVIKVREQIEKMEAEGPLGTRRRLLATSVRLSRKMAPDIHKMADECIEKLAMDIPLELYAYSSPTFNAACFKPEEGQLFVMFSSSLLEGFTGSELRFVMGHEFGHYIYHHHDIPIGYLVNPRSRPNPKLALRLFAWSRYAEISADRAGAYCAQDMNGVASSLFKLASGLTTDVIKFDVEEFLSQVEAMQAVDDEPGHGAPENDWFSTHPFSPLRVRALQHFHESELMKPGGLSDAAIAMRHLLFAGAVVVVCASGDADEEEIKVFEEFFEKGDFSEKLDVERIKGELPSRIERVKQQTTVPQRMQVLRDLCIVAKADGETSDAELNELHLIADALEVSRNFICQNISQDCEPD